MIMYTASGKDICLRQTLHYNNYEFFLKQISVFWNEIGLSKNQPEASWFSILCALSILERLGSNHNAKVSQYNKDVEIITATIIFFIGYWYLLISLSNI